MMKMNLKLFALGLFCLCVSVQGESLENNRTNVDIFPREPARNCRCEGDNADECLPCQEPFEWETRINTCIMPSNKRCHKELKIGGSAYLVDNNPRNKRAIDGEFIVSNCDKTARQCNVSISVMDHCDEEIDYTVLHDTSLRYKSLDKITMHLDHEKFYVKLEKPGEHSEVAYLPVIKIQGKVIFSYDSTNENDMKLELEASVCCLPKYDVTTVVTTEPPVITNAPTEEPGVTESDNF